MFETGSRKKISRMTRSKYKITKNIRSRKARIKRTRSRKTRSRRTRSRRTRGRRKEAGNSDRAVSSLLPTFPLLHLLTTLLQPVNFTLF